VSDFEPDRLSTVAADEAVLWRGTPQFRGLALRSFHLRKLALYFTVLLAWRVATAWADTHSVLHTAMAGATIVMLGAAAIGVLSVLAWLIARSTTYMITTRRVILRFGVALPMTVNVPLRIVDSAALRSYADGSGDIPLTLSGSDRIAYLVLWPHVRPWQFRKPQPALRAVPQAAAVAQILSAALRNAHEIDCGVEAHGTVEASPAAPRMEEIRYA
jgi:hypothetical protein